MRSASVIDFIFRSRLLHVLLCLQALSLSHVTCAAQVVHTAPYIHSEAEVPPYTSYDPLQSSAGPAIKTQADWQHERAGNLALLQREMYGFTPGGDLHLLVIAKDRSDEALGGKAVRWQVTLAPSDAEGAPAIHLLVYLPAHASAPVPVFLGLNYAGNQSITADPSVHLGTVWIADPQNRLVLRPQIATEASRGESRSEWPIDLLLQRGYGFATVYDGDLEPDFDGGAAHGFRSLPQLAQPGVPADQRWAAIGVWAWGLSRSLDALAAIPGVDRQNVIVIGHSRLGKAALWAAAQDTRFAAAISNESGKGGAALMRRNFGETIEHLNVRFPYWFDQRFRKYTGKQQDLPFDSSLLLALIAPRPLFVASAAGDASLDATGEFLATKAAGPVYQLYGNVGVPTGSMPPLGDVIGRRLRYYVRAGKHDMTSEDWSKYLNFADELVRGHGVAAGVPATR